MSIIISLLLIGISLSMDTFSVSLSIGTLNIPKYQILLLSTIVGILHFIMPIIGCFFGSKITILLNINSNYLLGIILLFIAIEMIIEILKKEKDTIKLDILNLLLISFSVSLDSFSTGMGILAITNNLILASFIFSTSAFLFTILGCIIGKYSNERLGLYSNIIGIILLISIGVIHLIK